VLERVLRIWRRPPLEDQFSTDQCRQGVVNLLGGSIATALMSSCVRTGVQGLLLSVLPRQLVPGDRAEPVAKRGASSELPIDATGAVIA
jgi:hypothetical protein